MQCTILAFLYIVVALSPVYWCKRAVQKVVRAIGEQPHAEVFRCVYAEGHGKGKAKVEFKWEWDDRQAVVKIRADKALYWNELSPPRSWINAMVATKALQLLQKRGGLPWMREGEDDVVACHALGMAKQADIPEEPD